MRGLRAFWSKNGNAIPKDIAAWMLLYHAMSAPGTAVVDMVSNNAHTSCMQLMGDAEAPVTHRAVAATLFSMLCKTEDQVDTIIRSKAHGAPCCKLLLDTAMDADVKNTVRLHAGQALVSLTSEADNAALCLQQMQQLLPLDGIGRLLAEAREDAYVKGHVANFLRNVMIKRDHIINSVANTYLIPGLLSMATQVRRDYQLRACMSVLALLAADRECWPQLLQRRALRIVTDVLGMPPPGYCLWEYRTYKLWMRHEGSGSCAPKAAAAEHHSDRETATPEQPTRVSAAQASKAAKRSHAGDQGEHGEQGSDADASESSDNDDEIPAYRERDLLSFSTLAIPFTFDTSAQTKAHAAECIYHFVQRHDVMLRLSECRAAYRLGQLLKQLMTGSPAAESGKQKASKKGKGVALDAFQISALQSVTGALKFLTVVTQCAYRVAQLGCLSHLIQLKGSSNLTVRRNAHTIIGNCAHLRENGRELVAADVPVEYLTETPLKLPPEDLEMLLHEYQKIEDPVVMTHLKVNGHLLLLKEKR